jgi:outer membrane receptor protein involved in Fe transport
LLGASAEDARRGSLRYATMLRLADGEGLNTRLTAGLDLAWLERARSGPADVIGAPPGTPHRGATSHCTPTRCETWSVHAGRGRRRRRALPRRRDSGERNSSFGSGYGTGLVADGRRSYVRRWDALTLKLRSAYGRGIRPPPPSARLALTTREYRQVANANLAPESQSGTEGGFAVYVGSALSLSATAFDQRADGLIQHVVPDPRVAPRAVQQQNVGEISNRGVEVALSAMVRQVHAQASLATVDSRVEALSRFYTGELRRGDRVPEVPVWSGTASVAFVRAGLSVGVGISYLGPWTGYDWIAYYSALANGVEVASLRSYWTEYASTARANVIVSQTVGNRVSWFARVDNLTNKQRDGRDNLQVLAGRTTRVGFSLAP